MGISRLRQFLDGNPNDPIFFIGTRAELIKVAPVITRLNQDGIPVKILWAGLHSEEALGQSMFEKVRPYSLRKCSKDQDSIAGVFVWFLQNIVQVILFGFLSRFRRNKSKIVVVHGDTLCTLLGSLFAKTSGAKLMHIEAGVRSGKFWRPFPEEISRRMVSRLADFHFAPGDKESQNLAHHRGSVINTFHNTSLDALSLLVGDIQFGDNGYLVVTLHRTELLSNKKRFSEIVQKIILLSESYQVRWYIGSHERTSLNTIGLLDSVNHSQIDLLERTNHLDFIKVIAQAHCVITDSGGLQSECNDLAIPVIVHRNESEYSNPDNSPCVLTKWDLTSIDGFLLSLSQNTVPRGIRRKIQATGIIATRINQELMGARS
jgi:UDP-N-acetylglucosamine 2-epimerase (non-hydrolysing)